MLPDTSFRSLFLLTGMTTCGCYSQPEDTEMITSVVGRYCCKSRKSSDPENLAKVDLWTSPQLRRFSTPLRRFVIDFG